MQESIKSHKIRNDAIQNEKEIIIEMAKDNIYILKNGKSKARQKFYVVYIHTYVHYNFYN